MSEQESHAPSVGDVSLETLDALATVLIGINRRTERFARHRANIAPRPGWRPEPRRREASAGLVSPERGGVAPGGDLDALGAPAMTDAEYENLSLLRRLGDPDSDVSAAEIAQGRELFGFDDRRPVVDQAREYLRDRWAPTEMDAWIERIRVMSEAVSNEDGLGDDDLRALVTEHGLVMPGDAGPDGEVSDASLGEQARSALAAEWDVQEGSAEFIEQLETARVMKEALMYPESISPADVSALEQEYGFDRDEPLHEQAREFMINRWFPVGKPGPESDPEYGAYMTEVRVPMNQELLEEYGQDPEFVSALEKLGARIEGSDIAVRLEVAGGVDGPEVEARADAWREVTAEELVGALMYDEYTVGSRFLVASEGGDAPVMVLRDREFQDASEDPAHPLNAMRVARIRPTGDGLLLETSAKRPDLDPDVAQRACEYFGGVWEAETQRAWFPVTTDQHADLDTSRASLGRPAGLSDVVPFETMPLYALEGLPAAPATLESEHIAQMGGLSLAEKLDPRTGRREALVWVDETQTAQTHPDLPSLWMDGDGGGVAAGNYEDGRPTGRWLWTGDDHSTVVKRAWMGPAGPSDVEVRADADSPWEAADAHTRAGLEPISSTVPSVVGPGAGAPPMSGPESGGPSVSGPSPRMG